MITKAELGVKMDINVLITLSSNKVTSKHVVMLDSNILSNTAKSLPNELASRLEFLGLLISEDIPNDAMVVSAEFLDSVSVHESSDLRFVLKDPRFASKSPARLVVNVPEIERTSLDEKWASS